MSAQGQVVLTGGAGLVGSHLVEALRAQGRPVVVVDDLSTGSAANLAPHADDEGVRFIERDVCDGIDDIEGPIEAVMHLASPASPVDFARIPLEIMRVGSIGTEACLRLARAHGARFLMASTSEVYGDPEVMPQPESYWGRVNCIGPRSVYDEAKRFSEAMTMAYHRHEGVDTRIVRIFNTYGPRMRPDDGRVITAFVTAALEGRPLNVHGDGQQTRSFCFVDDTVRGLLTVLDKADEQPVNVGAQGEMTILDFARLVLEVSGSTSTIVHTPAMTDDPRRREPDTTRLEGLGWKAEVALRDGLERTIAWFKAHGVANSI